MKFKKKSGELTRLQLGIIIIGILFFIAMIVYTRQYGDRAMYYVSRIVGIV